MVARTAKKAGPVASVVRKRKVMVVFGLFFETVSPHSPGCLETHCVAQTILRPGKHFIYHHTPRCVFRPRSESTSDALSHLVMSTRHPGVLSGNDGPFGADNPAELLPALPAVTAPDPRAVRRLRVVHRYCAGLGMLPRKTQARLQTDSRPLRLALSPSFPLLS